MSTESLSKDITEAIEKSLPAHVSETLQKRLALVDKLETELKTKELALNTANKLLSEARATIAEHNEITAREKAVSDREANVSKAELHLDKVLLEVKLAEANKRNDELFNLVNAVFRAPVVQRTLHTSTNGNVPLVGSGGYVTSGQSNENSSVTETQTTT
jgi:DNA primase catalytic subunit